VFTSAILLGLLWSAWHIPMFVLQGYSTTIYLVAFINLVAGSVIFSWLFQRTGGSVLVAVVAHMGAHLDNTNHALPANPMPFIVFSMATVVAAIAVVVFDRSARWFVRPNGAPAAVQTAA
jgi:membrane protease YdiL (CAAX protease family)